MRSLNRLLLITTCIVLGSCASKQRVMPDPDFAPVFPELSETQKPVTGSLYNDGPGIVGGISDSWFGRRKNFKVGDIVVVVLDERAQASRTQNTTVERETENDVAQGYLGKIPIIKNNIGGLNVDGSTITSEASGTAGQEGKFDRANRGKCCANFTERKFSC